MPSLSISSPARGGKRAARLGTVRFTNVGRCDLLLTQGDGKETHDAHLASDRADAQELLRQRSADSEGPGTQQAHNSRTDRGNFAFMANTQVVDTNPMGTRAIRTVRATPAAE